MKVAGIVAEYNPFHNGHKFQIDSLKNQGFTHIVTAMSGNFVQRGDTAVADKWVRTKTALENGACLVLEIPTCYCLAPAEKYCFAAVEVLHNTGVVDTLCFGSETAETEKLLYFAEKIFDDNSVDIKLKEFLNEGITYVSALEKAVEEIYGNEYSKVLKNPNDILGIEYLRALNSLNSDITPLPIKRKGVGHNDTETANRFASATGIREMIANGEDYSLFLPKNSLKELKSAEKDGKFPVFAKQYERVILGALRSLDENDFERLCDVSEGFHNRLFEAVKNADSLDSLFTLAKTKRYTLARIRRLVFCAALKIFRYEKPPYIRVLGFSQDGVQLLKKMKQSSRLPIVTSYSEAKKLSEDAKKYFETQAKYTDFYSMLMPKIAPKGLEFSQGIVKI